MKKNTLFFYLFLFIGISTLKAQIITTIAGNGTAGYSGDGSAATSAELDSPSGIAFDGSGNLYIADKVNNRVRKVTPGGTISTFAGNGTGSFSGDGSAATSAELNNPVGVAVDGSGNVYIADFGNQRIRKVNTSGTISTYAGNGMPGFSGDGGAATSASLHNPTGLACDGSGNLYIADATNMRVRKITSSGTISTIAGNGTAGFSGDGGVATSAELHNPTDVSIDASGNIYISDKLNYRIRVVNTSGTISTIAGDGTAGFSGDGGAATSAELNNPYGVVDASGNLYIADFSNNRVRKVNSSSTISTSAGNGTAGFSGDGSQATSAELSSPTKPAIDQYGNLYFSDEANNRIRVVYLTLNVTTSVSSNVTCNGGSNGSVSATPSHGATPYTYSWSGGGTNSSKTGLAAGTYTITVTDNVGVTGSATVTVTQPTTLVASATTTANVTCHGGSTGSVSATPSGGTSPYTYSWSGGGTNSTKTGLTAATYTVTVTDHNSCSATATTSVTQPSALSVSTSVTANVKCYSDSTGSISATPSGGTLPYSYSWSRGGTNSTKTGLPIGSFTITTTDNCGASATASVTITQPASPLIAAIASVTNISCSTCTNGAISISTTGGVIPYTYLWSNSATTTSISSLSAGTYSIGVTDANSCISTINIQLHPFPTVQHDTNIYQVYNEFMSHLDSAQIYDSLEDGPVEDFMKWYNFWEPRLAPTGSFKLANQVFSSYAHGIHAASQTYCSSGTPLPNVWTELGLNTNLVFSSGRVQAIAFDPTTSNTMYVGGTDGGVYRTTNAGSSWVNMGD